MEPISFAISIASLSALFETCLRGFELFEQSKEFGRSYTILLTRLDAQKLLFLIWGEAIGLHVEERTDLKTRALMNDSKVLRLIHQHLECIQMLFEDADQLRRRYGVIKSRSWKSGTRKELEATNPQDSHLPLRRYVRWFQGQSSYRLKARWAIQDQAKFKTMLDDLSTLLQQLRDITSAVADVQRQRNRFAEEIESCDAIEDLEIIEEALSDEDPVLSSAASERRTALTEAALTFKDDEPGQDNDSDIVTHADLDPTAQELWDASESLETEYAFEESSSIVTIYGHQNNLSKIQESDAASKLEHVAGQDGLERYAIKRVRHELKRIWEQASETPFISLGLHDNRIVCFDPRWARLH